MPDLPPLPPLGDTPRFAPSGDRFALAARAARRRRAVRTSLPAGALAAAVVAAVVTTGASAPSGLRPVAPGTTPSPTASASPMPTPSAVGGSAPASSAPAPASYAPTPSAEPSRGPTAAPAEESLTPSPTRRAVYVSPQPVGTSPPPERNAQAGVGYQQLGQQGCGGAWGPPDGGWCARYAGPRNVRAGESTIFQFDICRPAADAGDIVFAGERELEFALAKGADRADAGGYTSRPGSGPHFITVAPGWCARWAAPWRVPDLAEGTYDLVWAVSGERPVMVAPEQRQVTVVRP